MSSNKESKDKWWCSSIKRSNPIRDTYEQIPAKKFNQVDINFRISQHPSLKVVTPTLKKRWFYISTDDVHRPLNRYKFGFATNKNTAKSAHQQQTKRTVHIVYFKEVTNYIKIDTAVKVSVNNFPMIINGSRRQKWVQMDLDDLKKIVTIIIERIDLGRSTDKNNSTTTLDDKDNSTTTLDFDLNQKPLDENSLSDADDEDDEDNEDMYELDLNKEFNDPNVPDEEFIVEPIDPQEISNTDCYVTDKKVKVNEDQEETIDTDLYDEDDGDDDADDESNKKISNKRKNSDTVSKPDTEKPLKKRKIVSHSSTTTSTSISTNNISKLDRIRQLRKELMILESE